MKSSIPGFEEGKTDEESDVLLSIFGRHGAFS